MNPKRKNNKETAPDAGCPNFVVVCTWRLSIAKFCIFFHSCNWHAIQCPIVLDIFMFFAENVPAFSNQHCIIFGHVQPKFLWWRQRHQASFDQFQSQTRYTYPQIFWSEFQCFGLCLFMLMLAVSRKIISIHTLTNVYLLFGILRFSATMKHIFASFSWTSDSHIV